MDSNSTPISLVSDSGGAIEEGSWIALVSGLSLSSSPDSDDGTADLHLQLLVEYLKGELSPSEGSNSSSRDISALVVLGNSLDVPKKSLEDLKSAKRYNAATTWDPAPLGRFSQSLADLASSIPIHILPGQTDPAGALLPQQAMPRAMFGFKNSGPGATAKGVFGSETNPAWLDFQGCPSGLLATAGQNLDDVFKYVDSEDRMGMAKDMLLWRHIAPTCPDTLWCYPFLDGDPFLLTHSPSIYAVGNQPAFGADLVGSTRIVLVPRFSTSGEVVLVHTSSLAVKTLRLGLTAGWGDA